MIELSHVSKSFGRTDAVVDLSLEVAKGTIFGLIGPNGAGKSTTIRLITGVLSPDSGTITVGGISLENDPVKVKAMIGYVPDEPYIYQYLSGREFLAFVGSVYGVAPTKQHHVVHELLKLFPTIDNIDAPFTTYSRGTRQKLVFMAALLHEPQVLVIDEPMVGLDPQSAKVVKDTLRSLSKEHGVTVVLSTHTLSVAEEICDTIGIISKGHLVAHGTLESLRKSTNHEYAHLEELFLSLT